MLRGLEINLKLPDLWQQQAVRALKDGRDVVVDAPTGAGKTWVFELFFQEGGFGGGSGKQAVFTVPTRALANDKWREWTKEGWDVGIATGDIAVNLEAPVVVATLETQREKVLGEIGPSLMVVDEYQMIADENRGLNYELVISQLPSASQLLLLSGSVGNPEEIVKWLERIGREVELVTIDERPVPLDEEALDMLPPSPRQVSGFWPSSAARVVLADLSPLLVFVPHRAGAEKVARKIAAAFPEDDPIELPAAEESVAGKDLVRLLKRRIAFHHSGLGYSTRAGIIEPLAKRGQLRVIVATMGLAAGINFSVRTVLVAETTYQDGPYLKQLRSDELLQMFGRAGRRGLDDSGHVLVTNKSPRLMDAAPRKLRRVNEIDWPTLLRVMGRAVDDGRDPFRAAREVCEKLFSVQKVHLGFEIRQEATLPMAEKETGFRLGPRKREVLNSGGEWEPELNLKVEARKLLECRIHREGAERALRALRDRDFVRSLGKGSLCKIRRERGFDYGLEWKLGRKTRDGKIKLLGWFKKGIQWESGPLSPSDFESAIIPRVSSLAAGGQVAGIVERKDLVAAQIDFGECIAEATVDGRGVPMIEMATRELEIEVETSYRVAAGDPVDAHPNSAAFAWRSLGLVQADGAPTLRGRVFSFFQAGEGLMIAAALEDVNYPAEDLAWHIANLRAGFRFGEEGDGESVRLAVVARATYGVVDYTGYLELGLCPGYGDGAAEIVASHLLEKRNLAELAGENASKGDIERIIVEWLSMLRHIHHAPDLDWDRWLEFKRAARDLVDRFQPLRSVPKIPELPQTILNHQFRQRLARRDFGRAN
ncbi:MAG: DEAD/DEAH box helicase [Verrucomicrobiota bacterium]